MTSSWTEVLAELEASLNDVEGGGVARDVDLHTARSLGPIPDDLKERATDLAARALRLETEMVTRMADLESELGRHAPRPQVAVPPAPSHLDQLA